MRALLIPMLLLLSACAHLSGDKYPYAPQFVQVTDVCPCTLGAPPVQGSGAHKKEIAGILAMQAKLSAAEKAAIAGEDHITPAMMVSPVLGAAYREATHPALFTLLRHAASDAWRIADNTQDFWGRTRPWLVDARVQLLVKPITRPSYPSGHTVTNHVWAHVLSELFPGKRAALFARAHTIGMHRVAAGVHHPSDVAAGKRLAASIYSIMKANSAFQAELTAARAELKAPVAANDNVQRGTIGHCSAANANTMVMCR